MNKRKCGRGGSAALLPAPPIFIIYKYTHKLKDKDKDPDPGPNSVLTYICPAPLTTVQLRAGVSACGGMFSCRIKGEDIIVLKTES